MILWLLSCGSTPAISDSAESWDYPEVTAASATATWNAEQVETTLGTLAQDYPMPTPLLDAYLDLMAQGDAICPGEGVHLTDTVAYGCTSESGHTYAGISEFQQVNKQNRFSSASYWGLVGDFAITTPDGVVLEAGGHISHEEFQTPALEEWALLREIHGSWVWQGGDGWMRDGVSAKIISTVVQRSGAWMVHLDGAMSWAGHSVHFDDLLLEESCDWGGAGAVELRDPNGAWYRMEIADCGQCGTVIFDGQQSLDEACLDLTPLIEQLMEGLAR